jgi:serine/threonine protein kinase
MRRFGEDLLQALNHLEEQGVAHRDIKPDTIGIAPAGGSGRLRLMLFDFSLSRTPPENIQAGTRPYLDPFLALRPQRRWDLHAERYAAAVTLHELVVGVPPTWGDGATEPLVTEDEATIATDRFDPTLREGLRDFFTKALRRYAEERFGNAEDMLREWRRAFEPLDRGAIAEDSIETSPAVSTAAVPSPSSATASRRLMCSTAWVCTPSSNCLRSIASGSAISAALATRFAAKSASALSALPKYDPN